MLPAATSLRSATNVARSDKLLNNSSERATLVAERCFVSEIEDFVILKQLVDAVLRKSSIFEYTST